MKKKQPSAWREKLHNVFFEVARMNQEFERRWAQIQRRHEADLKTLGANATQADRAAVHRRKDRDAQQLLDWAETTLRGINDRYPQMSYNPLAYSYLCAPGERPADGEPLAKLFHWWRHRESLWNAKAARSAGNLPAYLRIARTLEDVFRALFRRGGVKPFQTHLVHQQFLELVLCYAREQLTAEELAECADTYCGCGKRAHDADALRKQYNRLVKDLRASAPSEAVK